MLHSLMVVKWGLTQWMFLYFTASGTLSLVTVHQPPVVTTALGHDVIMPCHLNLSHDEKVTNPAALYWLYVTQNNTVNPRVWKPSEKYAGRVDLLDNNKNTTNKSIVFRNVQWADGGKYLCKMSITTQKSKSFRIKGNGTSLMVYDNMTFNLTGHNDSLLWCEVNVTRHPGIALSIFHDGHKLQAVDAAPGDADPTRLYDTLIETGSPRREGRYECRLHLNGDLITESILHYHAVVEDVGDAEKNVSLTCPTTVSGPCEAVFPEPWPLYAALLLVPITVLLSLLSALLRYRR